MADLSTPSPLPLLPSTSRRLPPPCWSPEETVALIDAYREKWYSLRRGNLRANHWEEVADSVALRCPLSSGNPQKTSVQCRHKMEKLRKRYRSELQRAAAIPGGRNRYNSSWVHFNRMDSMEKGPTAVAVAMNTASIDEEEDDEEEEEDNEDEYHEQFYPKNLKTRVSQGRNNYSSICNENTENGYPFRIPGPGRVNLVSPAPLAMFSGYTTPNNNPTNNPNFGDFKNYKDGYMGKFGMGKNGNTSERFEKKESDPFARMVAAIKALGDGFVRMERMKMDMAREVEAMRMEMEVKRTEMILESQHRILESFTKAVSERKNKKVKRMLTPES